MRSSKMFTYILQDINQGIYKIGQTTNVKNRLRQLCVPGEIIPLKVYSEDLEKKLHGMFADCRIDNPIRSAGGGYTEWFSPKLSAGGKLQKFIDSVDIVTPIPFYTPHNVYEQFEARKRLRIDTKTTSRKLEEKDYYKYITGRKILTLLGYVFYNGMGYDSVYHGVEIEGAKTFITNEILEEITSTFTVDIVSTTLDVTLSKHQRNSGKRLFLRKIDELYDGTPIYLVVAETDNL